jgi:hypothetical protein
MTAVQTIDAAIDKRIGEVRTEALDLSFGEIANLYAADPKELIIQPEYQRLFRWSTEQRSRLVESILLELPIPQIFVIENSNGVIELIDGLQRVSSVIQFVEPSALNLEPLRLRGCDLIPELNDKTFSDLSLKLRLRLKRSSVRTIVIKRQSSPMLRYEMFKRLNTGGANLAPQEIRNCTARMLGDSGVDFYRFIQESADFPAFKNCTETLSQADRDRKGDEELVLRFFATKNGQDLFRGSVRDWLDDYMEEVLLQKLPFDYAIESAAFKDLFSYLDQVLGNGAFVRYRGSVPIGALAPAYYEAVTIGIFSCLESLRGKSGDQVKQKLIEVVQSDAFRDNTGPGANSKEKLQNRISAVRDALLA